MKKVKKYKYHILSFLVPLLLYGIMDFIFVLSRDKSILVSDLYAQHKPFLVYLYNIMHGNATFPYSFSNGIGGSTYGLFLYYLLSPTNLLVYFFKNVDFFILINMWIKVSLSGLTMFLLLKSKYKNEKINFLFSLCYSLSGYIILYKLHLMWLDGYFLAPLIMLGIDRMINKEKDLLYIGTLLYCLISNYFMEYMVAFFAFLYFFYELYISYEGKNIIKNNIKKVIHFIVIDVLCILTISFILIPTFLESRDFVRILMSNKVINLIYTDLLSGTWFGFGNINNPLNYYGIAAYMGSSVFLLLCWYFTSKTISKKEKRASFIMLLIMYSPVIIKPLSYIWHLFTLPAGFNYRYAFLLVLFQILLCVKAILHNNGERKFLRIVLLTYIIISISILFMSSSFEYYMGYLNYKNLIISNIIMIISYLLLIKEKKKILYGLLVFDLILNLGYCYYNSGFDDNKNLDDTNKMMKMYNDSINLGNDYRFEMIERKNFSFIYNYDGISTFNSTAKGTNINGLRKVYGIEEVVNSSIYNSYDLIGDMLLGVKYNATRIENSKYKTIVTYDSRELKGKIYLQENELALKKGYTVSKKVRNPDNYIDSIIYQNSILNYLDDEQDDYFVELDFEIVNKKSIKIDNFNKYDEIYVISDIELEDEQGKFNISKFVHNNSDKGFIVKNANTQYITLNYKDDIDRDKIKVYGLDYNKLKNFKNRRDELDITKIDNNSVEGEIDVRDDSVLMMTIPYEKGWTIYVDGKQTDYFKVIDNFIGFDISKGKHTIKMKYEVPGLKISIVISIISFLTLIVYELKRKRIS